MTNSESGRKAFEDANAALTANLADNPATSYESYADYKHGFFDGFVASRTQLLAILESPECVEMCAEAIENELRLSMRDAIDNKELVEPVTHSLAKAAISTIVKKLKEK